MRIFFASLPLALLATPLAAEPLEVLPSGHPVVEVRIGDSAPRRFVIDTAASDTTILPRLRAEMPHLVAKAEAAPLSTASGSTPIETSRIDGLRVDGRTFDGIEVILLPPGPTDALGTDGILGADVIADFAVEMDMPGRSWRMAPTADAEMLKGLTAFVPFVLDDQRAPRLTVKLDGVEVPAVLDTGAKGTIVNWAAARAIGLTPQTPGLIAASEIKGASNHATPSVKARLRSVGIGEAVVAAPEVRIADLAIFKVLGFAADQPAVILGIDMFADRRFVIDHPGLRLHISPPAPSRADGQR